MKYIFREKLYQGTRAEIVDQLTIDLRDLLDYDAISIARFVNQVPKTYNLETGIDTFSGTKKEIIKQYERAQAHAPVVVKSKCFFTVLGIHVCLDHGDHVNLARAKAIEFVKEKVNAL